MTHCYVLVMTRGISGATPLDTFKTSLRRALVGKSCSTRYAAARWLAWAGGGLTLAACRRRYSCCGESIAGISGRFSTDAGAMRRVRLTFLARYAVAAASSAVSATMLGCFYLDGSVTASTTNRGRLIFSALAGRY